MITKKESIRIPRREWESLRKNPAFSDLIELIEDRLAFLEAKKVTGKNMTLDEYLKSRGIRNRS
jgi:hypothetical protein